MIRVFCDFLCLGGRVILRVVLFSLVLGTEGWIFRAGLFQDSGSTDDIDRWTPTLIGGRLSTLSVIAFDTGAFHTLVLSKNTLLLRIACGG